MNDKTLAEAVAEAKRFLGRAEERKECAKTHDHYQCAAAGAVRRASMDLTRALSKLRRS